MNPTIEHEAGRNNYKYTRITLFICGSVLLYYSYKNLFISYNLIKSIICLLTSICVFFDFSHILLNKKIFNNLLLSIISFSVLCLIVILNDMNSSIGRTWIVLLPLILFYTQGYKVSFVTLAFICIILITTYIYFANFNNYTMRSIDYEQFVSFLLVTIMTYFYEKSLRLKTQQIEYQLDTDLLTLLPNRKKLQEKLVKENNLLLTLVNIDNFKAINNLYGTRIGDKVLVAVGQRLKIIISKYEYMSLYRTHSDEFAIVSTNTSDSTYKFIKTIPYKLLNVMTIDEIFIYISASLGVSKGNHNLLREADMALKHAKKNNKDITFYHEFMGLELEYSENISMIKKLREGTLNNRIIPYFQKIVNLSNETEIKYECLARLESNNKIIGPDKFLQIAKKSKLYPEITKIMVEKCFSYFFVHKEVFSINLSYEDLNNKETTSYIYNQLIKYDIGKYVVFEILENAYIEDSSQFLDFINMVKSFGCKIAIDDFGSGYSNFSYLLKFKVDYIKIDSSLIKNIDTDNNSRILTRSIVSFANELGIKTIAEHVNSESVLKVIKEIGVDYGQGFLFSKPSSSVI